jgi:hypothetical protein
MRMRRRFGGVEDGTPKPYAGTNGVLGAECCDRHIVLPNEVRMP